MNNRVTIFLTRKGDDRTTRDDVISVWENATTPAVFTVKYRPGDGDRTRMFYMCEKETMSYLSSMFKSLDYDTDPFDKIQITTAIHPSIIYDVAAVADAQVRYAMEDMIEDSLHTKIRYTE